VQLLQRFGQLADAFDALAQTAHVAAGQGGPAFLGRLDALAGLRQHGGIESTELFGDVVDRAFAGDAPRLAHGAQGGGFVARAGHGLRHEEQQVLRQAFGDDVIATRQRRVLHEHAGRGALHEDVRRRQRQAHRLEECRGQCPEAAYARRRGPARQSDADLLQAARRGVVAALDHLEQFAVELGPHGRVVDQGGLGRGQ
jgi:hypothetical protein